MLKNLNEVQNRNGIAPTKSLKIGVRDVIVPKPVKIDSPVLLVNSEAPCIFS